MVQLVTQKVEQMLTELGWLAVAIGVSRQCCTFLIAFDAMPTFFAPLHLRHELVAKNRASLALNEVGQHVGTFGAGEHT
jgi:hypothetical protein